ncbi:MAG: peptidoglycan-binding protein [Chthoniobacteraceae bacterium]
MNTKLFAGLALAAALLAGGPAFGYESRGGGGGRGAAVSERGGGGGGGRDVGYSGRSYSGSSRGVSGSYERSSGGGYYGGESSIAYGGKGYSHGYSYAFASHPGWNYNRTYNWNGRHYRWYGNGWFIVDPWPYYGYPDYSYYDSAPAYTVYGDSNNVTSNAPTSVQVQQELSRLGYYRGQIDGIIGPGTRAAIAAYQRDNGLHVTGTINSKLLDSLDLG